MINAVKFGGHWSTEVTYTPQFLKGHPNIPVDHSGRRTLDIFCIDGQDEKGEGVDVREFLVDDVTRGDIATFSHPQRIRSIPDKASLDEITRSL